MNEWTIDDYVTWNANNNERQRDGKRVGWTWREQFILKSVPYIVGQ